MTTQKTDFLYVSELQFRFKDRLLTLGNTMLSKSGKHQIELNHYKSNHLKLMPGNSIVLNVDIEIDVDVAKGTCKVDIKSATWGVKVVNPYKQSTVKLVRYLNRFKPENFRINAVRTTEHADPVPA